MSIMLPWPIVEECYGHQHRGWASLEDPQDPESCDQCDGRHRHVWASSFKWALQSVAVKDGNYRMRPMSTPIATRCCVCGGRKCDWQDCIERRHHRGPHRLVTGQFVMVGA